jgi:hypothetical protein
MFQQLLTPVAGALLPSFIVATLPVITVLVLLGVLRRPAWQASLGGLVVRARDRAWFMAAPGRIGVRRNRERCGLRAVADHVDRRECVAAL